MAVLRALCLFAALLAFFVIGAPLQWLIARRMPRAAAFMPLFFCKTILWILAVRVIVSGDRERARPVLLAANHVSWIDILALGQITPFCFLAKSEVASWPVLSAFAEVQGTVFVDRARRRCLPQVNRQMAARLAEGRSVLLFPEGTTLGGAEPGPFFASHFAAARDFLRMGAADGDVVVQPVALGYSSQDAAWVGDDDLLSHLWRTLRAPPLRCFVAFGAPIPYVATSNRKRVAAETREAIVRMLEARSAHALGDRNIVLGHDHARTAAEPC